jgi:hypothetical protein
LTFLGALWGGSFHFIRIAAPVFGPLVLMELRVGVTATILALYAVVVARHALRSGSLQDGKRSSIERRYR